MSADYFHELAEGAMSQTQWLKAKIGGGGTVNQIGPRKRERCGKALYLKLEVSDRHAHYVILHFKH